MTRRPSAGGSPHDSATWARRGESACTTLYNIGRIGSRSSPPLLSYNTPCGLRSWAQCGTPWPGTLSAGWGRRHWLPRGQPWRSPPGGDGGSPSGRQQSTLHPRSTGNWEWELPAVLPWQAPGGGATLRATPQMDVWPMAVMGGEASAKAKDTAPIPIVISDSSDDSDEGVLAPAVQADGLRARRRHCQHPETNSGTASGTRHPTSAAPHGTRHGATQVRPPPKTTSRPTQVAGATVRRGSNARDKPAGGAHGLRQVRRRTASAHAGSGR